MTRCRYRPLLLAVLALPLTAPRCGSDKDSGQPDVPQDTRVTDQDNDGFSPPEDCDDEDAAVNPGAQEVCDGIDNDCDELIDDEDDYLLGATTWYADGDADGFGDTDDTLQACDQPSGHAAEGGDCDDGDAAAHPGAQEVCDGADNDCDEQTDEQDDDVLGATTWNADDDGDGFGDPDATMVACSQPAWHVTDGSDCDDSDGAVYPGAAEICGDGTVNDCDGTEEQAFEACFTVGDLSQADVKLLGEGEGHGAGYPVVGAGDVNRDGYADLLIAAQGANPAGLAYLVLGPVSADGVLSSADARFAGQADGDDLGDALDGAGDVNADGYDDLVFGAPYAGAGGSEAGAAYLVLGPASGELDLSLADAKLSGENAGDRLGDSVAGAGDVNADGYDDLLVGSGYEESGGRYAGATYLLSGPLTGEPHLSTASAKLVGEAKRDFAGETCAGPGDVDGDGYADLLLGVRFHSHSAEDDGAAYLVKGPVSGNLDLRYADAKLIGEAEGDYAGSTVAGAGDCNADGYRDLLVGASGEDAGGSSAGAAYLLLGPVSGERQLATADAKLIGEYIGQGVAGGASLAGAGDVDADGYDDLLVGAVGEDSAGEYTGAAYLQRGPVTGTIDLSGADVKLEGEGAGDYAGYAVAGVEDVDADGFDDLLVGAMHEDSGGSSAGAVYLILGRGR